MAEEQKERDEDALNELGQKTPIPSNQFVPPTYIAPNTCPSCDYCPTCGRHGNHWNLPYTYPIWGGGTFV